MRTQDPPEDPLPLLSPVVVRRTPAGWAVESEEVDTLVEALVFADLVAADSGGPTSPGQRPGPVVGEVNETERLRAAVSQLQHALSVRVTIEQAIGILAERTHQAPREAFEELRKVARSHGSRVHDIAVAIVASVTDASIALPGDLPTRP
ncbi:ANTAR domain-containing protein [Fodinicola feengrottensis]|uniref:ANTAR domain-containing protein n=1 Tax=Fodinicola feengrottensis TaxID=435914 RepID=A0ABN2IIF5_9ACTN|nr:ANTAR domain-containing protein [Fodinicola feengrottensis]